MVVKVIIECDLDAPPEVVWRAAHDAIKRLRAADLDFVVKVVSVNTGRNFVVPHNDYLDVRASSVGRVDSSPGHFHIHWRPEPAKQCCA